jgi:hypothetical protein
VTVVLNALRLRRFRETTRSDVNET